MQKMDNMMMVFLLNMALERANMSIPEYQYKHADYVSYCMSASGGAGGEGGIVVGCMLAMTACSLTPSSKKKEAQPSTKPACNWEEWLACELPGHILDCSHQSLEFRVPQRDDAVQQQ